MRLTFPRLYAILDLDVLSARDIRPFDLLEAWLASGVRLIQLRAKSLTMGPLVEVAGRLAETARQADARFIINDRADVARLTRAAGVHLGQDDLSPEEARRLLLPGQVIGLSTHDSGQVRAAIGTAADYIAVGPVFATTTKQRPDPIVGLQGVAGAAAVAAPHRLPLVAIGGITLETAPAVIEAGADAVAVVADLLVGDPARRAAQFLHRLAH